MTTISTDMASFLLLDGSSSWHLPRKHSSDGGSQRDFFKQSLYVGNTDSPFSFVKRCRFDPANINFTFSCLRHTQTV